MEPSPAFSFREEDFSLFQEDRRSNNRFNKERLALKEKLAGIGARLAGFVPETWRMELGTEHPAIWNQRQVDRLEVFFMRPEEDRRTLSRALNREIPLSLLLQAPSPLYAHASLGFFVDGQGIEVGYRLPFLAIGDRSQVRRILSGADWPGLLGGFAPALPGFSFGLHSGAGVTTLDLSNPGQWIEGLELLERSGQADHRSYLGVVTRLPVSESSLPADELDEALGAALRTLTPMAVALSWTPARDLLGVEGMIAAQASACEAERARSEQLRLELIQPKPVVARPIMSSPRPQTTAPEKAPPAPRPVQQAPRQPPRPAGEPRRDTATRPAGEPRRDTAPRPSGEPRRDAAPRPSAPRPSTAPRQAGEAPARPPRPAKPRKPLGVAEPGAHVVLASGPFEGKEAVVLSALPDGQVRVRVGILQMTVDLKDCLTGRD